MKVINLSEQPSLLNQYLKEMRSMDTQKDSMRFRRNIERIGEIMELTDEKEFRLLELYELQ
jgi:uracil phosphoribosyltransferase